MCVIYALRQHSSKTHYDNRNTVGVGPVLCDAGGPVCPLYWNSLIDACYIRIFMECVTIGIFRCCMHKDIYGMSEVIML